MMEKIVLVAPLIAETEIHEEDKVSPAAAAWISRLSAVLCTVGTIDAAHWFSSNSAWPRGAFYVPPGTIHSVSGSLKLCSYINLPLIKKWTISRALENAVKEIAVSEQTLIIYGINILSVRAIKRLTKLVKRCVVIVSDAPPNKHGREKMRRVALAANGGVLVLPVSLTAYLSDRHMLLIPGVVSNIRAVETPPDRQVKRLVYVGGVDRHGGAQFLIDVLKCIDRSEIQIVIIGKVAKDGYAAELQQLGASMRGFVGDSEMSDICCGAFAFLNPRDPRLSDSATNFPSKLLTYMSYSKPIVSTDTPGMPRDLVNALGCAGIKTPQQFAEALTLQLSMDDVEWRSQAERLARFAMEEYSPESVKAKLEKFLWEKSHSQ